MVISYVFILHDYHNKGNCNTLMHLRNIHILIAGMVISVIFIVLIIQLSGAFDLHRKHEYHNNTQQEDKASSHDYIQSTVDIMANADNGSYRRPNMPHGIGHSLYINLGHRSDRMLSIESMLGNASIPFERVSAVDPRLPEYAHLTEGCFDAKECPGYVGCQYSHMKALEIAMSRKLSHVAIFEDDFVFQPFVNLSMVQDAVDDTMKKIPHWDVIALSLNIVSETVLNESVHFGTGSSVMLTSIHNAQTTGGFIVRDTIMMEMYKSFSPENCQVKKDHAIAIDQCWKPLQTTFTWVGFEPQPGIQMQSFSDIEQQVVDYGLS